MLKIYKANNDIYLDKSVFKKYSCTVTNLFGISDTNKPKLVESILIQNTDNFNVYQFNFKLDHFTNNIIRSTVFQVKNLNDDAGTM